MSFDCEAILGENISIIMTAATKVTIYAGVKIPIVAKTFLLFFSA